MKSQNKSSLRKFVSNLQVSVLLTDSSDCKYKVIKDCAEKIGWKVIITPKGE